MGQSRVDDRNRMVIPTDLRKALGVRSGETYEIFRLEGVLDIFGEALYVGVPKSRDEGLFLISYAPVAKDELMATMQSWAEHYAQIKSALTPTLRQQT
jgi:bifunctional DNA-binding transcriptional regulator/antitoxin component of YhaV-PrlF toxin-antitoxin module